MLEIEANILPDLFNSAVKLGSALGISARKSIEHLTKGLARYRIQILDNIGIFFQPEEALEWFRQKTGSNRIDQKQAWRQYAVKMILERAKPLKLLEHQVSIQQREARTINGKARYGKKLLEKRDL